MSKSIGYKQALGLLDEAKRRLGLEKGLGKDNRNWLEKAQQPVDDLKKTVKSTCNSVQESTLHVVSDRTLKSSQIFLGTLSIILVQPFLQKYFVKGIVLGEVKG